MLLVVHNIQSHYGNRDKLNTANIQLYYKCIYLLVHCITKHIQIKLDSTKFHDFEYFVICGLFGGEGGFGNAVGGKESIVRSLIIQILRFTYAPVTQSLTLSYVRRG